MNGLVGNRYLNDNYIQNEFFGEISYKIFIFDIGLFYGYSTNKVFLRFFD